MKKYYLEFMHQSEKEFLSLPRLIQKMIKEKMDFFLMADNPLKFAKKLHGNKNIFRFRIGDYRVLVTLKNKGVLAILLILKIGHRRDVYE